MEIAKRSIREIFEYLDFEADGFLDIKGGIRIYLKEAKEIGMGFSFLVLNLVEYVEEENPFGDLEQTKCEIFIQGVAYFDGLRHLHFGDEFTDNAGYFYYPHTYEMIEVMIELRKLEEKYCSQL